jgi:hypothetical protein
MTKPKNAAERLARLNAVLGVSDPANAEAPSPAPNNVIALPASGMQAAPAPVEGAGEAPADRSLAEMGADRPPDLSAPEKAALGAKLVAARFDAFRDENDVPHILYAGEAVLIGSIHFTDIVRNTALLTSGRNITEDNLKLVTTILRLAARDAPARRTGRRIFQEGQGDEAAHLLDLGDSGQHCAKVTANAIDIIPCTQTRAIFIRGKGYGELPAPVLPDDSQGPEAAAREAFKAMQPLLLGVPAIDRIPLIAALVERLRADTPHPILVASGPSGSGKTTVAARWIMCIDPYTGIDPPSVEADARAIVSTAQRRHSILMDNITRLPDLENLLCVSALGGRWAMRELYKTAESIDLELKAAWVITSIGRAIKQEDTRSRALEIRIEAPTGGMRRPDSQMRAEFAAQHPRALGALLWFLRETLRYVVVNGPPSSQDRMVDWETTGEAIAQALGIAQGGYTTSRAKARARAADDWLEGDTAFGAPVVEALGRLAKTAVVAPALPPDTNVYRSRVWTGTVNGRTFIAATAEGLRDELRQHVNGPELPATARATRDALDRVTGALTKAGWSVQRKATNGAHRAYWIFGSPL